MIGERRVAGLLCSEILEGLSEYLDGGLDAETRARVEAHVRDCDACTRFGGRFAATMARLRQSLTEVSVPSGVAERLRARMAHG